MRLAVICLAVGIGLAGCVSKYKTDSFTGPNEGLNPAEGFYVMLPRHATYGSKVYRNSGRETARVAAAALSVHAERVEVAERVGSLKKALARTNTLNLKNLFSPKILNWEDRATAWSGRPDRITPQFSVYDVKTGKRLVNSAMRASSKWPRWATITRKICCRNRPGGS